MEQTKLDDIGKAALNTNWLTLPRLVTYALLLIAQALLEINDELKRINK